MNALILVDIQNDFCPGGALAVPDGDEVVAVANRLSSSFELVVATQDWHPADHKSFAANHEGRSPGEMIELEGLEQILWPVHCVQQSNGAAFRDDLVLERVARVFQKGTDPLIDSYSGFFDNGRKRGTGLAAYLKGRNVTKVFVLGLATDYCVKFTALDAVREGFTTSLIPDGCRAVNLEPGDGERAIAEMKTAGVDIIRPDEALGSP